MKTIFYLMVLFSALFIGEAVFPYTSPCEKVPTEQGATKEFIDIANDNTSETYEITRLESGEIYDFNQEPELSSYDEPVFFEDHFNDDVLLENNANIDEYPCLGASTDISLIDDLEGKSKLVSERIDQLDPYRCRPYLYGIGSQEELFKRRRTP